MPNRTTAKPKQPELTITRIFDAPRDLVFKVWTDPKHIAQWWGPDGYTIPFCELELCPGGTMRIDMLSPDGTLYPGGGIVNEVVPPERLVYTARAFVNAEGVPGLEVRHTITFADKNGKTELTLHAVVIRSTPEVAEAVAGMEPGWNQSLNHLANHLKSINGGN